MAKTRGNYADIALAFEWEADEYAAITSYQLTHHLMSAGNFGILKSVGLDFAWGVAVSMVFHLMARLSGNWNSGSRTHPSALARYVWSMVSVEGAPECTQMKPNGETIRAGFNECGEWFSRNNIRIGNEMEVVTPGEVLRQFHDEYEQARAALAAESELLQHLASERADGAARWLAATQVTEGAV